jgi:hypothetical protein
MLSQMLTAVLKAVKMLLSRCPKNSQDAAVLIALKAVQDAEKNHPHKYQVQRLIPIILPLNLVRRLMGNLDHPGLGAELQEPDPLKRLGEQVCKLVLDVDVAGLDAPFLQTVSDEVVPHSDVLAPFMENGVLGQGQSGLAVHSEFHRSSVSAEEITKQSNKPDRLSRSGGGCYVFGLATGQGHHLLLDRLSANETLAKEEEDPARALVGVDVVDVVAVAVPDKVCLPRAPRVVEAVVESPRNTADDPLHSLLVLRCRSLHEPTNVANAAGVHGGTGCGGGGEDIIAAEVVAGQRSAEVGGGSGTGVDMLGGRELPTPLAPSKWTHSTVKLSYVGVEPSSTALSHVHPRPSSNTTSCVVRTRCVPGSRMR